MQLIKKVNLGAKSADAFLLAAPSATYSKSTFRYHLSRLSDGDVNPTGIPPETRAYHVKANRLATGKFDGGESMLPFRQRQRGQNIRRRLLRALAMLADCSVDLFLHFLVPFWGQR